MCSKFIDFVNSVVDESGALAKEELIRLISDAKKDGSDFVRLQAENLERWTVMLAEGNLTLRGYKQLIENMDVLTQLEIIRLSVSAKASSQRLAEGIQTLILSGLVKVLRG